MASDADEDNDDDDRDMFCIPPLENQLWIRATTDSRYLTARRHPPGLYDHEFKLSHNKSRMTSVSWLASSILAHASSKAVRAVW